MDTVVFYCLVLDLSLFPTGNLIVSLLPVRLETEQVAMSKTAVAKSRAGENKLSLKLVKLMFLNRFVFARKCGTILNTEFNQAFLTR